MQKTWFQTHRSKKSKMLKTLFRTTLKREIVDILALLSRLDGKPEILDLVECNFFLVQAICVQDMFIDWAEILCEKLASWLSSSQGFKQFYMSSYLIYAMATRHLWPSLPAIQNFNDNTKIYEFYLNLQLHQSFEEYVIVNDAFTMRISRELQGCPERRFSPEVVLAIS